MHYITNTHKMEESGLGYICDFPSGPQTEHRLNFPIKIYFPSSQHNEKKTRKSSNKFQNQRFRKGFHITGA